MKYAMKMIVYGVLGFFAGLFIISFNDLGVPDALVFWITVAFWVSSLFMLIAAVVKYAQLKNTLKKRDSYDDADSFDIYIYNQFTDSNLYTTFSLVLSLVTVGMVMVAQIDFVYMLIAAPVFFLSIVMQFITPKLLPEMYPDRDLPKPSDKEYARKLLEVSDEGERHIMLNGLYKSWILINELLLLALVLIILISVITGEPQTFSMIIIAAIIIISQFKYTSEIKERA